MKKLVVAAVTFLMGLNVFAANYDVKEYTMGYMPRMSAVYFQVRSGGCTQKEDFRVETQEVDGFKQVTLYRTRPDECLAFMPMGVIIGFSYQELGLHSGDHFIISNGIRPGTVM